MLLRDDLPVAYFCTGEQVQAALLQHNLPTYSARLAYTFLYVNTGAHQVLVDMGAGKWVPNAGELARSMDAAEKAWLVGTHFYPFPSLGTVVKKGEGWQWQPIATTE